MSNIMTVMRLQDNMTASLRSINNSLNSVVGSLRNVDGQLVKGFDSSKVFEAQRSVDLMNAKLNEAEENLKNNTNQQQRFNQELNRGSTAASGLLGNIRNLAGAYLGIKGMMKLGGLSDEMASATARLDLIVDDGGSVDALKDKIYASANDARALYANVMKDVSKLGLLAGKAFSNNDELIQFNNLANKSFVIGGASAQEQASAMYQLTQAMASGRLQGDEYRSIIENAPLLAKSIEEYMINVQHAKGTMKDWASEGLLTANVIKQAMFNAADDTNKKFESMPMTWSQVWNLAVNRFIKITQPVLHLINLAAQNWSVLEPIILGIAGAIAYLVITHGAYNAILGASNILAGIAAARSSIKAGATLAEAAATTTATGAQIGFNAALLACPITWIVFAIITLISLLYLVVPAINRTQNKSISATGIVIGCLYTLYAVAYNVFATMANIFSAFANFFANFMINPVEAVKVLINEMVLSVLEMVYSMVKGIENLINKIPGVKRNITSGFKGFIDSYGAAIQNVKDKAGFEDIMPKLKMKDLSKSFSIGYERGKSFDNKMSNLFNYSQNPMVEPAIETAKNTAKTADALEATKEDLKYLRDLAERDVINRFTTASLKIEQTNHNKIESDLDIDGVVDKLVTRSREALEEVAEGVHS